MISFLRDLLIISPQVVAGLWVCAGLSIVAAVRLLRQHRRTAVVAVMASCLLLPAAIADAVNAHYQYLPRAADVISVATWPTASARVLVPARSHRAFPRGTVVQIAIPGTASGFGTHQAMAYLPPQYFSEPTRRFPVVYLIHGSPGAPVDWFRAARAADAGLAAAQAGHPVVLVAPRASRYWSDDSECVDRPREHIETYLALDVPRAVDSRLRTLPDRSHRALAGNSAGGFCALNVGLRHRQVFGVLVDLSGYDRPTYDGGLVALFGSRRRLAAHLRENTPAEYVRDLAPQPRMAVWLDYGRGDARARRDARYMAARLRDRGQEVVLRDRPGGHVYGVWRPALRESLLWAAAKVTPPSGPSPVGRGREALAPEGRDVVQLERRQLSP